MVCKSVVGYVNYCGGGVQQYVLVREILERLWRFQLVWKKRCV